MPQDESPRKVKVTGEATHRKGNLRAAVKPHKRTTEASATTAAQTPKPAKKQDVKQLVTAYMQALGSRAVSATYWGEVIEKNAQAVGKNFGLAQTDEPYLLLDVSGGRGTAGLLMSTTGLHLSDGRGSLASTAWKDLPSMQVSCQRGRLVLNQTVIVSPDAQAVAGLLQHLQAKLA